MNSQDLNLNQGELDEAALADAMAANRPRLLALIESRLRSRSRRSINPQDVLHEVWVSAMKDRRSYRHERPDGVDRWLTGITLHRLVDAIEADGRAKRFDGPRPGGAGPQHDSYVDLFNRVRARIRTPSSEVAVVEARKAVQMALDSLPDARREVLRLYYIEGKSRQEVAEATQRTVSSVKSLLAHGLKQLEARLGHASRFLSDVPSSEMGVKHD